MTALFKTKKRILGTSLAVLLGMSFLAACSSGDSSSGKESSPIEFTIMTTLHTPEVPSDKIEKLIEEKTGTDINIQWVPDGNYIEKLNSAFATGTLPEATFLGNTTTFLQFKEAIRDDQFWEIGPLLDEFPNLKNLNEQSYKNTSVDGKIYALYQGRPAARSGLIYRKDWADKLGLSAPTNIDEFYEMARAFSEDDPDGNGKKDTFGITDRNDLIYGAFKTVSSWHGTPNNWGAKDGKVLPEFMFPEYIDTMKFFKELRDKGYINQDFPVTSKDDQQSFFKSGDAGMYVGSMGDVFAMNNDAVTLNPDVEFDVQNQIKGKDGKYRIWSLPGYGSVLLFSKSAVKTEEELKHILSFFDQLASKEVANLLFWGIEGEHFTVQDGAALQDTDAKLIDREVKPYQSMEIGEPATTGRYEGVATYDVRVKADELIRDNDNYLVQDISIPLESPTYIEIGERLNQTITDATYKFILGQIDEKGFEKIIEDWKKSGGDDIIKEFTEDYTNQNG